MDTLEHAALSELRHNLRTTVNQVLGDTELLIEDASEARNGARLEPLREVHSAAQAVLADINEALSGRESVERSEAAALREKMRPRLERIARCLAALRESREIQAPPEWRPDFDRIGRAAAALLGLFEDRPPSGPAIAPEPARQGAGSVRGRLLVVDDSASNRNSLRRRLERQGYAVEEAPSGDVALDRIATEPFDIVLLDILMPVMDGFTVLDRMRRDRRMRAVPVVVVSAAGELDRVVRAIEMGADDYVFKPFNPVLLRSRIGALLERKRLTGELAARQRLASGEEGNPLHLALHFARSASESAQNLLIKAPNGEIRALAERLTDDIGKILEHGKEADVIIGSMLARDSLGRASQSDDI